MTELGERGTRAAIVLTAGMSGVRDEGGRTMLEFMLEAAKPYNLRILGPNSLGLLIPGVGLNASFSHRPALPGNIAFVSQSGAMCTGVLDWARARGIGFSHFVSLGDCADVGFADVLDYLSAEPAVRAILLYMESLNHARRFMPAGRAAARNKPVLAIKAGRVPEAIRAAPLGVAAGSDAVYDATLRRAGMLRVFDVDELFAAVETLARSRQLRRDELTIMTNGGAIGVMAVDALIQGGGGLVELCKETLVHLARELISRTRIFKVLQGYRGHTAADVDAICLTLVKLSQLIIDIPHVSGVYINPLFADEHGVVAIETRIDLEENPQPATQRLAIRPYPQELEEDFTLKSGRVVRLRPIRPEDEPGQQAFIAKLTPEDIRLRFFGSVRALPHSEMARLTQIDYDREMAFIATGLNEAGKSETLGEVRTVTDPDNTVAEYSIIVRSDLKDSGLGRKLLQKMIGYCRARGTREFIGHVLRENRKMLALAEDMGFGCRVVPDDPETYEVRLDLRKRTIAGALP